MQIDERLMELLTLVQLWVDRQEADGCKGCAYWKTEEWEMPCAKCKRGCKDYYRKGEE